jgi:ABC-type branched-subunit amino acid transport system permease subunit
MGGALVSTYLTLDASTGVIFTLKALIVVIMGGVGDVRGTIVAALMLGILETFVATVIDPGPDAGRRLWPVHPDPAVPSAGPVREGSDVTITRDDAPALAFAALLFGFAALLPLTGSAYWMGIGISIAMFTVLSTSWALFSGPTHYISLATAAFFGLGTYTVGLGFETLPFWSLILIAAVIGAALAGIVGLATLRLSGVYFVIFTLGLAELVRQVTHGCRT